MFTAIGVEKTGRQITNHPDTMATETLNVSNEADNKIEVVYTTQGIHESTGGVSDRARSGNVVQVSVNETEINVVAGTQAIPDDSPTVPLSVSYT